MVSAVYRLMDVHNHIYGFCDCSSLDGHNHIYVLAAYCRMDGHNLIYGFCNLCPIDGHHLMVLAFYRFMDSHYLWS
jgi:hypothetical protein